MFAHSEPLRGSGLVEKMAITNKSPLPLTMYQYNNEYHREGPGVGLECTPPPTPPHAKYFIDNPPDIAGRGNFPIFLPFLQEWNPCGVRHVQTSYYPIVLQS